MGQQRRGLQPKISTAGEPEVDSAPIRGLDEQILTDCTRPGPDLRTGGHLAKPLATLSRSRTHAARPGVFKGVQVSRLYRQWLDNIGYVLDLKPEATNCAPSGRVGAAQASATVQMRLK